APTYVLRAAFDDIVPHSHTDLLVAKLGRLHADEIVPESDHLNIPYLPTTQARIAEFLGAQFRLPPAQASGAGGQESSPITQAG
ncbi:MAG: alpha/beta hydrolase, partial [Massilia sp.]|nr:alpha/beta hydrolase [Massilia sp.]